MVHDCLLCVWAQDMKEGGVRLLGEGFENRASARQGKMKVPSRGSKVEQL